MLPHSSGSLKVTAKSRHREKGVSTVAVYPVRTIRGVALIVWRAALKLARVHHKVANATSREELVNALPIGGVESFYPVHRRRPVRGWSIGALGQPKPLRSHAKVALITGSAKLHLRSHAGVEAK